MGIGDPPASASDLDDDISPNTNDSANDEDKEFFPKLKRMATETNLRAEFDALHKTGPVTLKDEIQGHAVSAVDFVREAAHPRQIFSNLVRQVTLINTIRTYQKEFLLPDFVAGFIEGIMAIPQGLAYASLVNMPAVYGLYVGLLGPFIYMIFGSCRQASFGTGAIEAVLIADSCHELYGPAPVKPNSKTMTASAYKSAKAIYQLKFATWQTEVIHVTVATSFVAGTIEVGLRLLQAGILAGLLSEPVVAGFSTGAAFMIATTQLRNLWAITLPALDNSVEVWIMAAEQWHEGLFNWWPFCFCMVGIVFLKLVQFLNQSNKYTRKVPIPGQLLLIIFATIICRQGRMYLNPGKFMLPVVSSIPPGLPKAEVPIGLEKYGYGRLFAPALKVGILNYIISVAIAKAMGKTNNYEVTGNDELMAMGMINIVSSFFQCYPTALSLSRTSVVNGIGAKSQMHCLICGLVMIVLLTKLTGPLHFLPKCCLTSIIYVALWKMVHFKEGRHYFNTHRIDFFFYFVSFVITIVSGAVNGVLCGIGVSLLWLIIKLARPKCSILGRLPGTTVYRSVERFPFAYQYEGIKIFRIDAPIIFSNCEVVAAEVEKLGKIPGVNFIIVDASSVSDVDSTGAKAITAIVRELKTKGITFLFANWLGPQRDFLDKTEFHDEVPTDHLFLCLHDAVTHAKSSGTTAFLKVEVTPDATNNTEESKDSTDETNVQLK